MSKKKMNELHSYHVVAIGASLGGLEAISELLKNIPPNTGLVFIIVQHLSPDHKSFLTSILSKITEMKVQEIENMEHMEPNNVYVIPNDKIIEVTDGHIKLLPRPSNSSILSIDVLFSSLAITHSKDVIGVILSGNAKDGTDGIKAIKNAGGITFAQDDSAQATSMPNSAINSGFVDYILSPVKIAEEITYLSLNKFVRRKLHAEDDSLDLNEEKQNDLNAIFELLLKETGVDFSHYKISTIKRRLYHQMRQNSIKSLKDFVLDLQENRNKVIELYQELLINVTAFFRDKETFNYLKKKLLYQLLQNKSMDETLRIWIPACSSGEEAYSLAMIIADIQKEIKTEIPVQLFATDLSEKIIQKARLGSYLLSDMEGVPSNYIHRFFEKKGDVYFIIKELREMCIFAPHNILRDPPFSRMDFVSCCNLLIYFDTSAQKKVFNTLHFALNEGGCLMLGKAESIGSSSSLFNRIDDKLKIYSKKKISGTGKTIKLTPRFQRSNMPNKKNIPMLKNSTTHPIGIESVIDSVLLAKYMPACVVVNKEMEILQFRGPVSQFLGHPSGKANLNILKMAQPEFAFELRNAILKTIETKETIIKARIEIKVESTLRLMTFEVCPLTVDLDEPLLLVVFSLQEKVMCIEGQPELNQIEQDECRVRDIRIKKLTDDLNYTRSEINSILESQEITFAELQSANEEIVSSNEEFQTLNEELETSKEEIEATNEELISTNLELQLRNDLLSESHEYSEAIYATIHEPILILDKNFHVKSANSSFYKKFSVKKEETEGALLFDLGNKQWDIPSLREVLIKILAQNSTFENFEVTHTFSEIGEKIMLLNARLIVQKANCEKLILLAIEDITEQSRFFIKENLVRKKAEDRFRGFLETAPDAIVIVDTKGKIQLVNSQTEIIFGYTREEMIGKEIEMLIPSRFNHIHHKHRGEFLINPKPRLIDHSKELFGLNKSGVEFPVEVSLSHLQTDEGILISAAVRDITEQKKISTELSEAKCNAEKATKIAEEAVKSKQQFLSNMSHEIRTPMNAIIGFTKLVLKTDLSVKQKEYLSAIQQSGNTLIVLIDDILDLAKVNAGKMTFESKPFRLKSSISSMIHLFETKVQEKNLILENKYDERIPDFIVGDSVRLNQMILNLISNAVKFTSEGKITLDVKLIEENDTTLGIEFKVIDTGIGIPPHKLATIFENFQQAYTSTSRFYGGTGLGLAIVKQLVECQGGSINVVSEVSQGSTFSFLLNFKKTNITIDEESEIIVVDTEIKHLKILVVEDIALNQLLMKTILDDFGFEIDIAENGKIAIEKIQQIYYDIVLMDLQMPVMNGFEATKYIRETLKLELPIIALTADVTTVDLEKCKAVGMNDYIAKPVDERLLYSKIINQIKRVTAVLESDRTSLVEKMKYVDLTFLLKRTKSNSKLMEEMIALYLKQTPPIVTAMIDGLTKKDWTLLGASIHKISPSFKIMGIDDTYKKMLEKVEKKIVDRDFDGIDNLVHLIEKVCINSCEELKIEILKYK